MHYLHSITQLKVRLIKMLTGEMRPVTTVVNDLLLAIAPVVNNETIVKDLFG